MTSCLCFYKSGIASCLLDYETEGGYLAWSWKTGTKTSVEDYVWSVGFYGLSPLDEVRGPNGKGCVTFKYSFKTQRRGFLTLKLMQVKLHSPVRLDAISSSEIWSEVARYRRIGRRNQRVWEQVSVLWDVSSPFLLEFVSSVENGVGEYSVKIDDFELQYTPCKNPSKQDPKVDSGGNTSPFGWVKRSLSASSGWCPKSLFRASKSKSSTRSNSRSFASSSSKSSSGSASNHSLGSNKA
nr:PREDICTED: uncharacterized protein LOC109041013 [Bemisia tabaci]